MHLTPLHDAKILIGKAVDAPDAGEHPVPITRSQTAPLPRTARSGPTSWPRRRNISPGDHPGPEAPGPIATPQLGPVGGRIVAEVFLGMLFGDGFSLLSLDPLWAPVTGPDFRLKDFVAYALGGGAPLH